MNEPWRVFDGVAAGYDAVRPAYPLEVFGAIESYAQFPPHPRVLEIGVGTGQATAQMAGLGWRVVGLEPGPDLASVARSRLAVFPDVQVSTTTFEAADVSDGSFDIVASATAWHWVDPTVGFAKAARVLQVGGVIALWWNAHVPDTSDEGWAPIRRVYEKAAPDLASLARLTPNQPDYDPAVELRASGYFDRLEQHVFAFSVTYSSERFLGLLDTYASHQRLDVAQRRDLYQRLEATIDAELGGTVTKPYEAVLVLARPLIGS